jgi:hypothetical protein
MRSDISKVLVTTPRFGSWRKNEEVKALRRERIDEDYDGPGYTSMRPTHSGWDRKELNEYLNPLYRFLQRRCGTPWDDVYSEIREHNRPGSAVGEHIFQHLRDYVVVKTTDVSRWFRPDFFVDGDGILCESPPRERWTRPAPTAAWRSTDDEHLWHVRRDDGCWFEWRLIPLPDDVFARYSLRDRVPSGFADGLPRDLGRYGVLRTLSRAEKKQLGI